MLVAIGRAYANLPEIQDKAVIAAIESALLWFTLYLFLAAALFLFYTIKRQDIAGRAAVLWARRQTRFLERPLTKMALERDHRSQSEAEAETLGKVLLIFVFLVFLGFLWIGPHQSAALFPRAMAVPIVVGGWVPALSYLSGLGRQLRAPLILGFAAVMVLVTFVFGDTHTVRRIVANDASDQPVDTSPLDLAQAVALWKDANKCAGDEQACPRPIIVAAAGGASRAAFFTASVLGHFLERRAPGATGVDSAPMRSQLFAISSVSGSSVAAVKIAAAFAAEKAKGGLPCRPERHLLWFGGKINHWRDCLEALTSGDYLTAVFIGLAFHDVLRILPTSDRATMLEQSWERHFAEVAPPPTSGAKCWGLSCPFMTVRPTKDYWLPLLVLNGTSVETGQRIVTTPLAHSYQPRRGGTCPALSQAEPGGRCRLFALAAHFHDMLVSERTPQGWLAVFQRALLMDYIRGRRPDDISLSTAAHNSARFPILSPVGIVRGRNHAIVDRIVDGGYYENFGALGATELALAIRAIDPGLAPFVLVISNDPELTLRGEGPDEADEAEILSVVTGPIATVANVRGARGLLALEHMQAVLDGENPGCDVNSAHIRVHPQTRGHAEARKYRAVSMSWWLSRPVQNHLNSQTKRLQTNPNLAQVDAVWRVLGTPARCGQPQR
jgi:hypothetical protein